MMNCVLVSVGNHPYYFLSILLLITFCLTQRIIVTRDGWSPCGFIIGFVNGRSPVAFLCFEATTIGG